MHYMKRILLLAFILFTIAACNSSHYVISTQLPVPVYEKPIAPGPGYVWIDGDWKVEDGNYIWHEGHWRKPKVHKVWHPGYWQSTTNGWYWQPGRWQ
jgi:hypothetical protein